MSSDYILYSIPHTLHAIPVTIAPLPHVIMSRDSTLHTITLHSVLVSIPLSPCDHVNIVSLFLCSRAMTPHYNATFNASKYRPSPSVIACNSNNWIVFVCAPSCGVSLCCFQPRSAVSLTQLLSYVQSRRVVSVVFSESELSFVLSTCGSRDFLSIVKCFQTLVSKPSYISGFFLSIARANQLHGWLSQIQPKGPCVSGH